jgi:hypothetical protein
MTRSTLCRPVSVGANAKFFFMGIEHVMYRWEEYLTQCRDYEEKQKKLSITPCCFHHTSIYVINKCVPNTTQASFTEHPMYQNSLK